MLFLISKVSNLSLKWYIFLLLHFFPTSRVKGSREVGHIGDSRSLLQKRGHRSCNGRSAVRTDASDAQPIRAANRTAEQAESTEQLEVRRAPTRSHCQPRGEFIQALGKRRSGRWQWSQSPCCYFRWRERVINAWLDLGMSDGGMFVSHTS